MIPNLLFKKSYASPFKYFFYLVYITFCFVLFYQLMGVRCNHFCYSSISLSCSDFQLLFHLEYNLSRLKIFDSADSEEEGDKY